MSTTQVASSTEDTIPQVPFTTKDRIGCFLFGAIALTIGICMIAEPTITNVDTSEVSLARTKLIVWVLELIWSRPAGVILSLIGLALFSGGIFTKTKNDPNYVPPEKTPTPPPAN